MLNNPPCEQPCEGLVRSVCRYVVSTCIKRAERDCLQGTCGAAFRRLSDLVLRTWTINGTFASTRAQYANAASCCPRSGSVDIEDMLWGWEGGGGWLLPYTLNPKPDKP